MIRNHTDPIIIRPRVSPIVVATIIGVGLIVAIALLFATYIYGRNQHKNYLDQSQRDFAELTQRYDDLQRRHEGAQDMLAQVQRQLQMDKSAYVELRKELESSNLQLADLRNELKFYRSIITPDSSGAEGVRVENFSISPGLVARKFQYKLVLVQPLKDSKEIKGVLSFNIKGKKGGETVVIEHPPAGSKGLAVKFKFFQNVAGNMDLPENFIPAEIRVKLKVGKKNALNNQQWHPWSGILVAHG